MTILSIYNQYFKLKLTQVLFSTNGIKTKIVVIIFPNKIKYESTCKECGDLEKPLFFCGS